MTTATMTDRNNVTLSTLVSAGLANIDDASAWANLSCLSAALLANLGKLSKGITVESAKSIADWYVKSDDSSKAELIKMIQEETIEYKLALGLCRTPKEKNALRSTADFLKLSRKQAFAGCGWFFNSSRTKGGSVVVHAFTAEERRDYMENKARRGNGTTQRAAGEPNKTGTSGKSNRKVKTTSTATETRTSLIDSLANYDSETMYQVCLAAMDRLGPEDLANLIKVADGKLSTAIAENDKRKSRSSVKKMRDSMLSAVLSA